MLNTSVYNGKEQRIRRTDAGQTNGDYTMYFYMGGALAFSTNSDANYITDENIIDPNGTIIAGKRQDNVYNPNKPEGQYWIYHYDARGSVTNIIGTNASGALYRAENNVYDAFGKDDSGSATPTTSIKNEVKVTGAVQDSNGLYYLSSRHYDPNTGRFLQQDTVSGDPYSPWTQNLYTYTSNNPVNYIDPTGHSFISNIFNFFKTTTNVIRKTVDEVKNAVCKIVKKPQKQYPTVTVNTYVKHEITLDVGHVDITIGEKTYSYGRYDQSTIKSLGIRGDGVMVTGPGDKINSASLEKGRTISHYELNMTDQQRNRLVEYFSKLENDARIWVNTDERGITKYKFPPSHRYATYSLWSTNCTTFVCDALKYAYQDDLPRGFYEIVPYNMDMLMRVEQNRNGGIVKK